MTLATRCSACGTSFRVVQDQLKVSGGWVRCGRCNEVFNALDALYEIDTQPGSTAVETARQAVQSAQAASRAARPAAATTGSPAPMSPAASAAASPAATPVMPPAAPPTASASAPAAAAAGGPASSTPAVSQPSPGPATGRRDGAVDSGFDPPSAPAAELLREAAPASGDTTAPVPSSLASDLDDPPPTASGALPTEAAALSPSPPLPPSEPAAWDDRPVHGFEDVETRLEPRPGEVAADPPSFMRGGPRPAPMSPQARRLWGTAAGALGLLLVVQLSLSWRDSLAAQVPATRPWLEGLCRPLGCVIEAPRRISALAVEGSNLRQKPGLEGRYELMVALRNRSGAAVRVPAVELTLTDSQGQALIRRVLLPDAWQTATAQLGPGADVSLQTVLQVTDRRIAGYTVEIFYP
jgi:predicted Zn finger-like uncharacterized protein